MGHHQGTDLNEVGSNIIAHRSKLPLDASNGAIKLWATDRFRGHRYPLSVDVVGVDWCRSSWLRAALAVVPKKKAKATPRRASIVPSTLIMIGLMSTGRLLPWKAM